MKKILRKMSMPEWAMHYSSIIIMLACFLVAFGIYGLDKMNKNEFPKYTIREAVIVGTFPGATSEEVEQQVTKPVEDFVFQHPKVKKKETTSITQDGLSVITVDLTEDVKDPRAFWNKMKHELATLKESLPKGVYSLQLDDEFGNSSALLVTIESKTKTYKELKDYMDQLCDSLRDIPTVGKLVTYGMQNEQISIILDYQKLSKYGIYDTDIASKLSAKGFITTAGRLKTADSKTPLYVSRPINKINDIMQTVVYNDPTNGKQLRLKDVAAVRCEYAEPTDYITYNGTKCLLLSVEKKDGVDISRMGAAVNSILHNVEHTFPKDVKVSTIDDLSKVVDDSVYSFLHEIIIATIASCRHFFKSILSATMAISITFFPFIVFMSGGMGEFLASFPVAMAIILFISMFVAQLVVPIVQYLIIRKPLDVDVKGGKKHFSMLLLVQQFFDNLIDICFRHKKATLAIGFSTVIFGAWLITKLPQELMPVAERNQFAVEIYTPTGTSLKKTSEIADSLEHMMLRDKRIVSIASFHGTSSPRFVDGYAPQTGGSNFAQFIVNTPDKDATFAVLPEMEAKYSSYFPNAYVHFKQISYSEEANPVEVRIQCSDMDRLRQVKDSVIAIMHTVPDLYLIRSDMTEPTAGIRIALDEDKAATMGITNEDLEQALALRYGDSYEVGSIWEGNYERKMVMKSYKADSASINDVMSENVPVNYGIGDVPLRQISHPEAVWTDGQIPHRNELRNVTVMAEVTYGKNVNDVTANLEKVLSKHSFGNDVHITYGGKSGGDDNSMPEILMSLAAAVVIIFFILVWHFKNIREPLLMICCMPFCLLGTAVGTLISGNDFSLTSFLGLVSLMGILVRDGIILFDFARELMIKEKISVEQSVIEASKLRMRPILLTSFAASVGVLPMLISRSTLWMPMAAVICFGTIITLFYIRTMVPVLYSLVIKK